MKLDVEQLARLPKETEVIWSFQMGSTVSRHRAIIKKRIAKSLLLHVYKNGPVPEIRRWSLDTNKPSHEYGSDYCGEVWLERANSDD